MRILLLSDIHANIVALEKVLASAGAFDQLWCLGDLVGYGPAPNECVERLRELNAVSLAGNHDWAVLDKLDIDTFNTNARRAVVWTKSVLTAENREWLASLPDHRTLPDDDLTLVHASPRHPIWEYILTSTVAAENLPFFETNICLFGHTHVPIRYRSTPEGGRITPEWLPEGKPQDLRVLGKCLLNPGSVGQPRDRDPRAAFAVLDLEERVFTYHRVAYDIAQTQLAMRNVNLPRPLIERLDHGV